MVGKVENGSSGGYFRYSLLLFLSQVFIVCWLFDV